ncbi:type II toxin-antitoxin system VapB family antitoxin [Andreprevotia chitinilytica]|uniref:type II toxin-antitoxin system VapB family antitoxin n=1 Tax=Andreprevotia chitinilytica TaxID=396808 RepID=UPI000690654F|nr:type II toxin-antitoxin system VapB family antitoxin [Andreprevotia chitinilytica]
MAIYVHEFDWMNPMRTHVELDDDLLAQVIALGQFPTKKAAIHAALADFAKTLKRQQLLALRGKVQWQGDLEQLRSNRAADDAG